MSLIMTNEELKCKFLTSYPLKLSAARPMYFSEYAESEDKQYNCNKCAYLSDIDRSLDKVQANYFPLHP